MALLYLYRKRREVLENSHPPGSALKEQHKDFSSLYTPRNDSGCELQLTLEHQDFELFFFCTCMQTFFSSEYYKTKGSAGWLNLGMQNQA